MTKKCLEQFADRIKRGIEAGWTQAEARIAAQVVVEVASRSNPRFDRIRFLAACGIES